MDSSDPSKPTLTPNLNAAGHGRSFETPNEPINPSRPHIYGHSRGRLIRQQAPNIIGQNPQPMVISPIPIQPNTSMNPDPKTNDDEIFGDVLEDMDTNGPAGSEGTQAPPIPEQKYEPKFTPIAPVKDGDSTDSESEDDNGQPNFVTANTTRSEPVNLRNQRYFRYNLDNVISKFDFNTYKCPEARRLEINNYKDVIIKAVGEHRVTVIQGYTGCGKTTQIPQFLLDECVQSKGHCNIVVTQPRKLAVTSTCRRVCQERGWKLGTLVGYKVGLDSVTSDDTLVTFMTAGVLLNHLCSVKSFKKLSHIIIDEVHERDLENDFLLCVIRKILLDDLASRSPKEDIKIVLMSATITAEKFAKYFTFDRGYEYDKVPIIVVANNEKSPFGIREIYLHDLEKSDVQCEYSEVFDRLVYDSPVLLPQLNNLAVNIIVKLDDEEKKNILSQRDPRRSSATIRDIQLDKRGSVLVFLPGIREIETLIKALDDKNMADGKEKGDPNHYKWTLIPLHSTVSLDDQLKAFEEPQRGYRKIICATNIAESSITVPDVVYVIDFCLTKAQSVDERTNYNCLKLEWASKSQCNQRRGRTGRVAPGIVYRLVTNHFFNSLEVDAMPEMLKSNLDNLVLQAKDLDLGKPVELLELALDPPEKYCIERAVLSLKEAGALTIFINQFGNQRVYDKFDGDLTFLGRVMLNLPVSHHCARLIMFGHCFGVLHDCIIIAASLSVKPPFTSPFNRRLEAYMRKLDWAEQTYSDCFALLFAYKHWASNFGDANNDLIIQSRERIWGKSAFVHTGVMREIRNLVKELEKRLSAKGIEAVSEVHDPLKFNGHLTEEQKNKPTKEACLRIKIAIGGAFYPNYFQRYLSDIKFYERCSLKEVGGYDIYSTVYYKKFPRGHDPELYMNKIADLVQFGNDVPKVIIPAQGEKVFVNFEFTTDRIGPICKSVYRVLKLQQLKQRLLIHALRPALEHEYKLQELTRYNSRLNLCTPLPPLVDLPGIEVSTVYAEITSAENPSCFYVVYSCHRNLQRHLEADINENLTNVPLREEQLMVDTLCLAPYGQRYYRARICSVGNDKKVLVFFVDYGTMGSVHSDKLQGFSKAHRDLKVTLEPMLAVKCRLAGIKPSVVYGSVWDIRALTKFRSLLNELVRLDVYAVTKSVVHADITCKPNDTSVRNSLIKHGFGEEEIRHYDGSEDNHQLRVNYRGRGDLARLNFEQLAGKEAPVLPSPTNGTKPCELHGPFSPLSIEWQSICHSSSTKKVFVEQSSVNTISLDQEAIGATSRVLVSADVSIRDKTEEVILRETTMMPAIRGMMPLLAMIFAPKVELRIDEHCIDYTGAICGLGVIDNETVYPDHDIELVFDTCFDDDDLHRINQIRHHLNVLLGSNNRNYDNKLHLSLINAMSILLKKNREHRDLSNFWGNPNLYEWNTIPAEHLQWPLGHSFPDHFEDIFAPIMAIKMVPLCEGTEQDREWDFAI